MNDYQLQLPIVTPRLVIRKAARQDMKNWSALYRSPKVRQHMTGPLKRSARDWWLGYQRSMSNVNQVLSITLTETNEFVGVCGFFNEPNDEDEREVWLMLRAKFWGKAMGTEIASALTKTAFELLSAKRVIAIIAPDNQSSLTLFKKLGFSFIREHLKVSSWQNGHHIYGLDCLTYESALKSKFS